jgi:transcriptional regulator with XRE-family HTH domain
MKKHDKPLPTLEDKPDEQRREFGDRIRELRKQASMTIEQLSQMSGVSRAMVSKVERGEKSPTIGVATRISRALNTSLSFLTSGEEQRRAVAVVRQDQRPVFRDKETGFERHMLSPPIAGGGVEVLLHILPAGASTGALPAYPRGTEKYVVVEKGELIVTLPEAKVNLLSGDTLFFEAEIEHTFENRSSLACCYYLIIARRDKLA